MEKHVNSRSPDGEAPGTKSFSELAAAYAPELTDAAARRRLKKWVNFNPQIMASLKEAGYKKGQRVLTPKQVGIIYDFLGEP